MIASVMNTQFLDFTDFGNLGKANIKRYQVGKHANRANHQSTSNLKSEFLLESLDNPEHLVNKYLSGEVDSKKTFLPYVNERGSLNKLIKKYDESKFERRNVKKRKQIINEKLIEGYEPKGYFYDSLLSLPNLLDQIDIQDEKRTATGFEKNFFLKYSLKDTINKLNHKEKKEKFQNENEKKMEKHWRYSYFSKTAVSDKSSQKEAASTSINSSPITLPYKNNDDLSPRKSKLKFTSTKQNTIEGFSYDNQVQSETHDPRTFSPIKNFRVSRTSESFYRKDESKGRASSQKVKN